MRVRLTDRRVEKFTPKTTTEYWDLDLRGFGIRVNRGGRRSFMVQTRIGGKLKRITLGKFPAMSVEEARKEADRIINGVASSDKTFEYVCEQYLEHYVKAKELRTARMMETSLRKNFLPMWGKRLIITIKRSEIREFMNTKGAYAPYGVTNDIGYLRRLFNWALAEGLIDASPAARLTPPSPPIERERVLSEAEIQTFWRECDRIGKPYGKLFQFLLVTGQRRNEAARMRWDEIDGDLWLIPSTRSKNKRGHGVPLTPLALTILNQMPKSNRHVFAGAVGDKPVTGFGIAKGYIDGIVDWRLHDLRRTMATQIRRLGVDRLVVSKILNHKEGGVTRIYDRYGLDDEQREAMELWSTKLKEICDASDIRHS